MEKQTNKIFYPKTQLCKQLTWHQSEIKETAFPLRQADSGQTAIYN